MNRQEEGKTPPRVPPSQTTMMARTPALSSTTASSAANLESKSTGASTREARLTPQEKDLMLDINLMSMNEFSGKYITEG
jgi:hypothetical protein